LGLLILKSISFTYSGVPKAIYNPSIKLTYLLCRDGDTAIKLSLFVLLEISELRNSLTFSASETGELYRFGKLKSWLRDGDTNYCKLRCGDWSYLKLPKLIGLARSDSIELSPIVKADCFDIYDS